MKGIRAKQYMLKNKKVKTKRCKFEGCNRAIRCKNKSGYCNKHHQLTSTRRYRKNYSCLSIDKDTLEKFKDYCADNGFIMNRKSSIIIKEFLDKEVGK